MGHAPRVLLRDEPLARLAAQGDRVAFDVLFARHRARLLRCARAILRDDHDAQDALQTTALKALYGLPRRRAGVPVRPWLLRIAANESISILRRRRSRPVVATREETAAAPNAGPLEQTLARAELELLLDDLTRLTEGQRTALLLRHVVGAGYDEIAATLRTTPLAARRAVSTARGNLAALARGRDAECDGVRLTLAAGDRRALRSLSVGAHLRTCSSCRALAPPGWRDRAAALVPALPGGGLIAALRDLLLPVSPSLPDGAAAPLAKGFAALTALTVSLGVATTSTTRQAAPRVPRASSAPETVDHPLGARHHAHHAARRAAATTVAAAARTPVAATAPVVLAAAPTHSAVSIAVTTAHHSTSHHLAAHHVAPRDVDANDPNSSYAPPTTPVAYRHHDPSPSQPSSRPAAVTGYAAQAPPQARCASQHPAATSTAPSPAPALVAEPAGSAPAPDDSTAATAPTPTPTPTVTETTAAPAGDDASTTTTTSVATAPVDPAT